MGIGQVFLHPLFLPPNQYELSQQFISASSIAAKDNYTDRLQGLGKNADTINKSTRYKVLHLHPGLREVDHNYFQVRNQKLRTA